MKPKKPFMIEGGPTGNELLHVTPKRGAKWVDWDGDQFATLAEAQAVIDKTNLLHPAKVIEIIDQTRARIRR